MSCHVPGRPVVSRCVRCTEIWQNEAKFSQCIETQRLHLDKNARFCTEMHGSICRIARTNPIQQMLKLTCDCRVYLLEAWSGRPSFANCASLLCLYGVIDSPPKRG